MSARDRRAWIATTLSACTAVAAVAVATGGGAAAAPEHAPVTARAAASNLGYINPVAPAFEQTKDATIRLRRHGTPTALDRAWAYDGKHAGGNPQAAQMLAAAERRALRTGRNPSWFKQAPATQTARLLTVLVEFDPAVSDDFSGTMVPRTVFGDRTCVPGTPQSGPLHNRLPNPANKGIQDNYTFWVRDFSPEHYNAMLYSTTGITQRIRRDLRGPDGGRGIDISGYTMRNHYEEMSKGAYTVTGSATPWVTVPHSEAWYGADRCVRNADGTWVAGPPQAGTGHPDNPNGQSQLATDAVNALVEQHPEFPLADYDVEDQFDRDGDGERFEPDGYIDHVVLVHAGSDKARGGGAQGTYAIWSHSSTVLDAAPIGDTGLRLANYIVQPEDAGVGVFSHEYGHDLGLPDLYDVSGAAESDIEFWDVMSSGAHAGPISQTIPVHMGIWDKWVLGWADPEVVPPGTAPQDLEVGQTSRTPAGTEDGLRILLPDKPVTLATPHSGARMWWSGNDQHWADVRLSREVAVPAGQDVRFWMWNDYVIEADWDFGFVEVSTDGGATWQEQEVFAESGERVSTPADYPDPNGRMRDFGGKKFGLTGTTHGWRHDYVNLTPFAGQTVQLRLRYATDEAFLERGWFADDISITADGTTVFSDDAEAENGWTKTVASFTTTTGAGWRLDSGTRESPHYYLAEWRTRDGFDRGLRFAYDAVFRPTDPAAAGAWRVEKLQYNAPGMLVWYRDTSYGTANAPTATTLDLPSAGSKGGLLLVDSHFDPLRHRGTAAEHYVDEEHDPQTLKNVPVRVQASDNAFTTWGTYAARDCFIEPGNMETVYCTRFGRRGPVSSFTDALGWYPGIEARGGAFTFRDQDGSVVIPSRRNQPYSTRVVDQNGDPVPSLYGTKLLDGRVVLGSGNPGDEGKQLGVTLSIVKTAPRNRSATIRVTAATPDGQ